MRGNIPCIARPVIYMFAGFSRSAELDFHHSDGARYVTTDFKCDVLCLEVLV